MIELASAGSVLITNCLVVDRQPAAGANPPVLAYTSTLITFGLTANPGAVVINGVTDGTTSNVVQLFYTNHTVFQINASGGVWYFAGTAAASVWVPVPGGISTSGAFNNTVTGVESTNGSSVTTAGPLLYASQLPGSAAAGPTTVSVVNCTFISVNGASGTGPLGGSFSGGIARNCAFFGYGATGNAGWTFDHCATSASSFGSGTDGGNNVFNLTAASQFINPTSDWRLLPNSALINAGIADLTNIPSGDDIAGTSRRQGLNWDIGCWERLAFSVAEIRPPPNKFW